jgi:hypothetical protein
MPPVLWPLQNDRPMIQVVLSAVSGGQDVVRRLLAESNAASNRLSASCFR